MTSPTPPHFLLRVGFLFGASELTGRSFPQPAAAMPTDSAPQPARVGHTHPPTPITAEPSPPPSASPGRTSPTHAADATLLAPVDARLEQLALQSVRAAGAARVCAERLGRMHAELRASERREREARERCSALSTELERSSHALQARAVFVRARVCGCV